VDLRLVNLANPDATSGTVNPGPATPLPQELLGEFYTGAASPVDYYNPSTGSWAQPSGNFSSYTFNADGTFEFGGLLQSTLYSCTSSFFSLRRGTVQLNGTQMTLNFLGGRVKYTSSCDPGKNYDRPASTGSDTYTWRVGPGSSDPSRAYLYLTNAAGQEDGYVKK
jgi:hypothetical protein